MPARGLCRPVQRLLPGEGALYQAYKDKASERPLRAFSASFRLRPANPLANPLQHKKKRVPRLHPMP